MPTGSRQIEMTWKCSACGHKNLGRFKTCQECGDPKDKSEKYEMPTDTAGAASVTDDTLLTIATGGRNWRCSFCGSDQRKADNTCAVCGAPAAEAEPDNEPLPLLDALTPWGRFLAKLRRHKWIVAGVGGVIVLIVAIYLWTHRTRTFTGKVTNVAWTQTISVERYRVWDREGWRGDQPSGAFDVVSRGQLVHHYDDVLDGYDTQYYTEQVRCGEDCTDVPETCHESCSDNGNGFATCRTVCSGGGRRCSPKYCSESRSRQVPRYRKEPRYAEAIGYKIWDWGFDRKVDATGTGTTDLRWPVAEARLGVGLTGGEKERENRSAKYVVTLAYDDSDKLVFDVTLDELPAFAVGSSHALRIKRGDPTLVDGKPVKLETR